MGTTKQACRDELVVYLFFFSHIYIYIYIYKCLILLMSEATHSSGVLNSSSLLILSVKLENWSSSSEMM